MTIPQEILKRKGATKPSTVPQNVLQLLNTGQIETVNLSESLAIDQATLWQTVNPHIPVPSELTTAKITQKMAIIQSAAASHSPDNLFQTWSTHPSDTIRGWSCYLIPLIHPSLPAALNAVMPLAADPHFGVREWAWLALRTQIAQDPDTAIQHLTPWVTNPDPNIRRFATESTRPRGVWCAHITELKQNPQPALPLLEPLKSDPSRYVQNSVANWLNDAAKTHPEWVQNLCQQWQSESPTPATAYITKRAQRSIK